MINAYIFSINSKEDSKFYVRVSDENSDVERIYSIDGTLNQAELYAAQFVALCSRRPIQISITTDSYYLEGILAKNNNKWEKNVEGNAQLVQQTRNLFSKVVFTINLDEQKINKIRSSIL